MAFENRTPEQQKEALDKARLARAENRELLQAVKSGKITLAQILGGDLPESERAQQLIAERGDRVKVATLLRHAPGIGPKKTPWVMEELDIAENRRVGGLGVRQRKVLTEKFSK